MLQQLKKVPLGQSHLVAYKAGCLAAGVRLKAYFVPLNSATDKDGMKALK